MTIYYFELWTNKGRFYRPSLDQSTLLNKDRVVEQAIKHLEFPPGWIKEDAETEEGEFIETAKVYCQHIEAGKIETNKREMFHILIPGGRHD